MEPSYANLARVLTQFSTNLQKGENVLIEAADIPHAFVIALVHAVQACGAYPFVHLTAPIISRELWAHATTEQYETACAYKLERMKHMQVYIGIRGSHNIFETSDVPADKVKMVMKALKPVQDYRVNHTKWVILRWPTAAMAQQAHMSTQAFEEFFFKVCTFDYAKLIPGMQALKQAMEQTDKVHIKGDGVDLRFSIKDIPAIMCGGTYNIPDGEVFTAPIKNSVEGEIKFNTPTVYQGIPFENVHLKFEKGKIVAASSNNNQALNNILDSDAGARYIGEFAIGFNPHVLHPMRDILFDEKIAGSFHFTPGQAYEEADNGNRSQVHWDLVSIQRPDYGGGEIWFDDQLIRKEGLFIPKPLQALNPNALL
jgi:aminopeptidase